MKKKLFFMSVLLVCIVILVLFIGQNRETTLVEEVDINEVDEIDRIYIEDHSNEMKYAYIVDRESITDFSEVIFRASLTPTNTSIDSSNRVYWIEVHSQSEELFTLSISEDILSLNDSNMQSDFVGNSTSHYKIQSLGDFNFITDMNLDWEDI
ncbi:hypothetical protein ACE1TF_09990 [Geomicrobium sp. JSM 1781026]|uniref:hypothetical protein n=1 Tax=Geomicrobium sp. JSM 1781026 TaxID=3344580 RepID=UPI0035BEFA8B